LKSFCKNKNRVEKIFLEKTTNKHSFPNEKSRKKYFKKNEKKLFRAQNISNLRQESKQRKGLNENPFIIGKVRRDERL